MTNVKDTKERRIAEALRELIKRVVADCRGAYGREYDGEYDEEIKAVAREIGEHGQ